MRAAVDLEKNLGAHHLDRLRRASGDGGTRHRGHHRQLRGAYRWLSEAAGSRKVEAKSAPQSCARSVSGIVSQQVMLTFAMWKTRQRNVDLNIVYDRAGEFIELQGTGEESRSTTASCARCWLLQSRHSAILHAQKAALEAAPNAPLGLSVMFMTTKPDSNDECRMTQEAEFRSPKQRAGSCVPFLWISLFFRHSSLGLRHLPRFSCSADEAMKGPLLADLPDDFRRSRGAVAVIFENFFRRPPSFSWTQQRQRPLFRPIAPKLPLREAALARASADRFVKSPNSGLNIGSAGSRFETVAPENWGSPGKSISNRSWSAAPC